MNVLSLFDGISCGQQALKELGAKVEKYYASEIDKHAIAITQHQHPNTIQLGDVTKWREWDIDWASIDLVQGGSPCQGFSFAGKQLNFDDPRSALFFVFADILEHAKKHNPNVKFLLENVRMKKEHQDVISQTLGVQPVMINSALVSAQNRVRLYWTNIGAIEQPKDRGILLRHILEETGETKQRLEVNGTEKANSLTTVQKDSLCVQVGTANIKGFDSIKRVYSPDGKSPTLTTMGGGHREPKVEVREKSKCVRSSGLGSYDRHEWDSVGDKGTPLYWRKLTPLECERLQTLKDYYTVVGNYNGVEKQVSNSQRYRALGNGWTVEVIKHIYRGIIT